jgi:hypothetical protein
MRHIFESVCHIFSRRHLANSVFQISSVFRGNKWIVFEIKPTRFALVVSQVETDMKTSLFHN